MLALSVPASSSPTASTEQAQVRRYLLSAGANNGGRERVLLRYAVSDARAFASVLTDMGGVDKNNALVLTNPGRKEFLGGITNLGRLISGEKAGTPDVKYEVFIYYSGHADGDGLKLGSETLNWADFRGAVNAIDADIRVAVIDACGSGAITRTKGGVLQPAFLSDVSSNMKGYAFLTSSNEHEASQECDRIKGSFFTHALLGGLRGAADLTGDGKVTINEAYQYAFNETLRNTQNTSAGTQHPSRDMNLAGTGDIVMTDLRRTSAVLSLAPDTEGRFFIRDESGNLFAELHKSGGRQMELGVPPGRYAVEMEALLSSRRWIANNIVIAEGQKTTLAMNDMRILERRGGRTLTKGDWDPGNSSFSLRLPGITNVAGYSKKTPVGIVNVIGTNEKASVGLLNVVGINEKASVGLLNVIGSSDKRSVGLVNVVGHSDKTPFGLLSFVGNGIYDVTTYADVTGDYCMSVRTGTPWFYNIIEYSTVAYSEYSHRTEDKPYPWIRSMGYGLGTRFGMNGRFTLNFDLVRQNVGDWEERVHEERWYGTAGEEPPPGFLTTNGGRPPSDGSLVGNPGGVYFKYTIEHVIRFQDYYKLRFGASYTPWSYASFTAGISLNGIIDSYGAIIKHEPAGGLYGDRDFDGFKMRYWPGVYFGVTMGKVGAN